MDVCGPVRLMYSKHSELNRVELKRITIGVRNVSTAHRKPGRSAKSCSQYRALTNHAHKHATWTYEPGVVIAPRNLFHSCFGVPDRSRPDRS